MRAARPEEQWRDALLAVESYAGDRAAAWDAVLALVGGIERPDLPTDVAAPWRAPGALDALAALHESSLDAGDRVARGSFYTPPALVGWLLDRALPAGAALAASPPVGVLDPACGAGAFLVPVAQRLLDAGLPAVDVAARLHGTDLDPVAVGITRLRLRALLGVDVPGVRVADGLAAPAPGDVPADVVDVVVGNPPFGGQLRRRTTRSRDAARGPGAYTDTAALFLRAALDRVAPGGTVALVQPLSVLAARDAAPVRRALRARARLTAAWATTTMLFPGARVLTCAVVARADDRDAPAPRGGTTVATWAGADLRRGPDVPLDDDLDAPWGVLAAPAAGIPVVAPRTLGVLGDEVAVTADFRDEYYGLVPYVREAEPGDAPLVTSGLLEPAECCWGEVAARFAGTLYERPGVDVARLLADGGPLAAWAGERRVPKLLVATQGRLLEAAADPSGEWLPSVPVLTVVPADPARTWHHLAVLLAPPVAARAGAAYLGAGLSADVVKLSARQVAGLPLPADRTAWDDAAVLVRAAQEAGDDDRVAALAAYAEVACAAYGDRDALDWWLARLARRPPALRRKIGGSTPSDTAKISRGAHHGATARTRPRET